VNGRTGRSAKPSLVASSRKKVKMAQAETLLLCLQCGANTRMGRR
jgi:hypothetical protein